MSSKRGKQHHSELPSDVRCGDCWRRSDRIDARQPAGRRRRQCRRHRAKRWPGRIAASDRLRPGDIAAVRTGRLVRSHRRRTRPRPAGRLSQRPRRQTDGDNSADEARSAIPSSALFTSRTSNRCCSTGLRDFESVRALFNHCVTSISQDQHGVDIQVETPAGSAVVARQIRCRLRWRKQQHA